jgi:predicted amidohydrolase
MGKFMKPFDNRSLRVAILQPNASLRGVDERFAWLELQICELSGSGIDLLVCPELYMTGYDVGENLHRYAEPVNGKFAVRVSALAQKMEVAIVYGYPERDGNVFYNSAICIGADGSTLANHRKSVLPPGFETRYFQKGSNLTLLTLKSVRLAILICYESEFPESVRNVAQLGAEVVVVPTATGIKWGQVPNKVIPTRAFENGVFVLYANYSGKENQSHYFGGSCIVDPMGRELARAGHEEEILSVTLDCRSVQAAQARLPYLSDCSDLPTQPAGTAPLPELSVPIPGLKK